MPERFEEVWRPEAKSQEFMNGPRLTHSFSRLLLAYDHEGPTGEYLWSGLEFSGVHAFTFTAYRSCSTEQVRAYDRLVRVSDSVWLAHLAGAPEGVRHFRIYYDDIGAYDIAAHGYRILDSV